MRVATTQAGSGLPKPGWKVSCLRLHGTGEPGRTPLYVGLPSTWGSVDGD